MNLQRGLTTFCMLALSAVGAPAARATIVLGPAGSYTVISNTGASGVSLNNGSITGNVGIANTSGQLANGNQTVNGNVDFAGPVNVTGPSHINGTTTANVDLSPAVTAFTNLSNTSNTNAAGAPSTALSGIINITSGAYNASTNTYYFNLTGNQSAGSTITINGAGSQPGSNVVFNVSGNLSFNNTTITLAGGLTTGSVLFNVTGTGNSLSDSGGSNVLAGIMLDPGGQINFSGGGTFSGSIYGGGTQNITFSGSMAIGGPASGVPEPSTFAIAATFGVASFGYWFRRRKSKPAD